MAVVRDQRIAAVSYLNTVPFVYGIRRAGKLRGELLLSPPAGCARAYMEGEADVALVPVGALKSLPDAEIITTFCIGVEKNVRTVVVMSDVPIKQVRRLWLDSHSMTSSILVRILAAELWGIKPEWRELEDYSMADSPGEGDAFLLIGDKVFDFEGKFRYTYDLSECWRELTGLPMVFAVWVARKGTSEEAIQALEESLEFGVERIWEAVLESDYPDKEAACVYLTENIDFLLDGSKRRALDVFWDKGMKFVPRSNPG
jgi:chorismate dehydratase